MFNVKYDNCLVDDIQSLLSSHSIPVHDGSPLTYVSKFINKTIYNPELYIDLTPRTKQIQHHIVQCDIFCTDVVSVILSYLNSTFIDDFIDHTIECKYDHVSSILLQTSLYNFTALSTSHVLDLHNIAHLYEFMNIHFNRGSSGIFQSGFTFLCRQYIKLEYFTKQQIMDKLLVLYSYLLMHGTAYGADNNKLDIRDFFENFLFNGSVSVSFKRIDPIMIQIDEFIGQTQQRQNEFKQMKRRLDTIQDDQDNNNKRTKQ